MNAEQIKPNMQVVCGMDENAVFGTVDSVVGSQIKLKKDENGEHHFIPVSFAREIVDGKVQMDRPAGDVKKQWTTRQD